MNIAMLVVQCLAALIALITLFYSYKINKDTSTIADNQNRMQCLNQIYTSYNNILLSVEHEIDAYSEDNLSFKYTKKELDSLTHKNLSTANSLISFYFVNYDDVTKKKAKIDKNINDLVNEIIAFKDKHEESKINNNSELAKTLKNIYEKSLQARADLIGFLYSEAKISSLTKK